MSTCWTWTPISQVWRVCIKLRRILFFLGFFSVRNPHIKIKPVWIFSLHTTCLLLQKQTKKKNLHLHFPAFDILGRQALFLHYSLFSTIYTLNTVFQNPWKRRGLCSGQSQWKRRGLCACQSQWTSFGNFAHQPQWKRRGLYARQSQWKRRGLYAWQSQWKRRGLCASQSQWASFGNYAFQYQWKRRGLYVPVRHSEYSVATMPLSPN